VSLGEAVLQAARESGTVDVDAVLSRADKARASKETGSLLEAVLGLAKEVAAVEREAVARGLPRWALLGAVTGGDDGDDDDQADDRRAGDGGETGSGASELLSALTQSGGTDAQGVRVGDGTVSYGALKRAVAHFLGSMGVTAVAADPTRSHHADSGHGEDGGAAGRASTGTDGIGTAGRASTGAGSIGTAGRASTGAGSRRSASTIKSPLGATQAEQKAQAASNGGAGGAVTSSGGGGAAGCVGADGDAPTLSGSAAGKQDRGTGSAAAASGGGSVSGSSRHSSSEGDDDAAAAEEQSETPATPQHTPIAAPPATPTAATAAAAAALGTPTPSKPVMSRLPGGLRVKLLALSARELAGPVKTRVRILGICAALRREHRVVVMAGRAIALGMGPHLVKRRRLQRRAVVSFAAGLGPMAVRQKRLSYLATVLMAFACGPFGVRSADEAEEKARSRALKKARKVAHKLRAKASAAKTKDVRWAALDKSLNTMWDTTKRPIFSPKDTLRLLLGFGSEAHSDEAREARATRRSSRGAGESDARDGASTTLSALVERAEALPDLESDEDDGEAEEDENGGESRERRTRRMLQLSKASDTKSAADAEVTDLVTHPAQRRIHSLIFGDDLTTQFVAAGGGGPAKPKAAVASGPRILLDPKIAQAVGIGMRTLGVPSAAAEAKPKIWELCRAIARGDIEAAGGFDSVVNMRKFGCYGGEASEAVMSDPRGADDLPVMEMYVRLTVGSVPHVQSRLELMTIEEATVEQIESAARSAETLHRASVEVVSSALLVSLLRDVVLPTGNALNRFTKNAAASGFRLSGLGVLLAVKSGAGENLVQYIARKLVGYADTLRKRASYAKKADSRGDAAAAAASSSSAAAGSSGEGEEEDAGAGAMALVYARRELTAAEDACKVSVQAVEADLTQVKKALLAAKAALHAIQSSAKVERACSEEKDVDHADEAARFTAAIESITSRLESEMLAADETLQKAKSAFDRAMRFFGEDLSEEAEGEEAKLREPGGFFGSILAFLTGLEEAAAKAVEGIRKRELRQKEEARKAARRSGKPAGGVAAAMAGRTGKPSHAAVVSELSSALKKPTG
jgi:hypothetical protein